MIRKLRRSLIRFLISLLLKCIRSELKAGKSTPGLRLLEGPHPCQLFIDAVDSTTSQLSQLIDLLEEQTELLDQCLLEHPQPVNPQPLPNSEP